MDRSDISIDVRGISKGFRVYYDKGHTIKDRVLFRSRNKHEYHKVLDNISFQVRPGEAIGLIGHNGCGKSTTLKLLNRILYPDNGEIKMRGRVASLIELGAGFHPDMSGKENIYINASIFGLKSSEITERLDEIISFSELEEYIDNPVRTYSSGMYMRLAFSIAINVDADILLVDEILAVGDANFQKKCFDRLCEIKQQGTSIVIVSHDLGQIKRIADRVLWLDHGRIRKEGPAYDVCYYYLIEMADRAEKRARKEREKSENEQAENPNEKYPTLTIARQTDATSRHSGDMTVRFAGIEMLNGEGRPCQDFFAHENIYIQYVLADKEIVSKPVHIEFRVYNLDGQLCCSVDSRNYFRVLKNPVELNRGKVLFKDIHLGSGDYSLDAVIKDENDVVCDYLVRIIKFQVHSDPVEGRGIAVVKNTWEVTNV